MDTRQLSRFRSLAVVRLIAAALCLPILLCGSLLFHPSIRARYIFRQLESLQVGHSTFEDAQRLAQKLGAKPYGSCDRSYCFWTADVNNARLPQWWRGSGVTFAIDFEVKDSLVAYKGAWYAIGTDPYSFSPSPASAGSKGKWSR